MVKVQKSDAPCPFFTSGECVSNNILSYGDNSSPSRTTAEAETEVLNALVDFIKSSPNGKICTVGSNDVWNLSGFYATNAHIRKGNVKIKALCTRNKDVLSWKMLEDGLDWISLSNGSNSDAGAKVVCYCFRLDLLY